MRSLERVPRRRVLEVSHLQRLFLGGDDEVRVGRGDGGGPRNPGDVLAREVMYGNHANHFGGGYAL